jgi:hypothetical protein
VVGNPQKSLKCSGCIRNFSPAWCGPSVLFVSPRAPPAPDHTPQRSRPLNLGS